MRIVYIADDGTEFNDEYDCRDYEWMLERKEVCDLIEFYDTDGNRIKNIMTENAYNKVWTIVVPTEEAAKAIVDLGYYQGFSAYLDICSAGTWEWHEDGRNGNFVRKENDIMNIVTPIDEETACDIADTIVAEYKDWLIENDKPDDYFDFVGLGEVIANNLEWYFG